MVPKHLSKEEAKVAEPRLEVSAEECFHIWRMAANGIPTKNIATLTGRTLETVTAVVFKGISAGEVPPLWRQEDKRQGEMRL